MVFVMILIRINSSGTSASCAAGVICFFIYYSGSKPKSLLEPTNPPTDFEEDQA